jgi:hypothetical protein
MEKKKYLIISGCSFTGHKVEPNIAWPNHLDSEYEIIDCSEMASGNALISRNLIANIPHYLDKDPTVVVMWSNPNRFELFYNQESSNYNKIYNDMTGNSGFQNQPITGKWSASKDSNWLKSGGGFGHWEFDNADVNQHMKMYLANFHNEELQFVQTLEHILRIQWYCKANNLRLINMCWQDIFTGQNNADGNNSTERGELIVNQYENAIPLWELVDWTTWWFHHSHKQEWSHQYGGLKEWCIDNGYEQFPGSHPTTEAQKDFASVIVQRLINET